MLIISVLFALALLSYAGLRARGFDVEARSNLRNAAVMAKVLFNEHGSYTGLECADFTALEPVFRTRVPCHDGDIRHPDSRDHGVIQVVTARGYTAEIQVFSKGSRAEYTWITERFGDTFILDGIEHGP